MATANYELDFKLRSLLDTGALTKEIAKVQQAAKNIKFTASTSEFMAEVKRMEDAFDIKAALDMQEIDEAIDQLQKEYNLNVKINKQELESELARLKTLKANVTLDNIDEEIAKIEKNKINLNADLSDVKKKVAEIEQLKIEPDISKKKLQEYDRELVKLAKRQVSIEAKVNVDEKNLSSLKNVKITGDLSALQNEMKNLKNDFAIKASLDKQNIDKELALLNKKKIDLELDKTDFERKLKSISFDNIKKEVTSLKNSFKNFDVNNLKGSIENIKSSIANVGQSFKDKFNLSKVNKELDTTARSAKKMGTGMQVALGTLAGNAAMQGVLALGRGIKSMAQSGMDFQASLADFSAITGVSGSALDKFGEKAKELSNNFGTSAQDQITTFKGILSRLGPDIAKSPAALEEMTVAVNTLARASGLTATESMDALTTAALQMGVDLSNPTEAAAEMTKMMNVMAAGAKEGAAEVPQVAEALTVAGAAARSAGMSIEETNAAIQVMAMGGKYGAEAGTALRNVLGLLQNASGPAQDALATLGTSTQELGQVLTEQGLGPALEIIQKGLDKVGTQAEKNALILEIFGNENSVAAQTMLDNADAMSELEKKITGTSVGFDQAATNMNTFAAKMDKFKANIQNVGLELFESLEEPLSTAFEAISKNILPLLTDVIGAMSPVLTQIIATFSGIIQELTPIITNIIEAVTPILPPIIQVIGGVLTAVMPIVDMFVDMLIPVIDQVVVAFSMLVDGIKPLLPMLFNVINVLLKSLFEPLMPLLDDIIKLVIAIIPTIVDIANILLIIVPPLAQIVGWIVRLAVEIIKLPLGWLIGMFTGVANILTDVTGFLFSFVKGISDVTQKLLRFLGLMGDKKPPLNLQAPLHSADDLGKKMDDTGGKVDDLGKKMDDLGNTTPKVRAPNTGPTEKAIAKILTAYKTLEAQLEYIGKLENVRDEKQRLLTGRAENIYDEVEAYQKQKDALTKLNTKFQEYIDKYKLTIDENYNIVSFGVKLKQEQKDELQTELKNLKLETEESEVAELNLKLKIQENDKAYKQKLADLQAKELEWKIKIGTVSKTEQKAVLEQQHAAIIADIEQLEAKIATYSTDKEKLTTEELQQLTDLQNKYVESKNKEIDLRNEVYDITVDISKDTTDIVEEQINKEIALKKKAAAESLSIMETLFESQQDIMNGNIDNDEDKAIKQLEKDKENELITEEFYEKQKEKLHERYDAIRLMQQAAFDASKLELKRQADLEELQMEEEKLQKLQAIALEAGDTQLAQKYGAELDALNIEIKEKSDIIGQAGDMLAGTLAESFGNMLIGGDEETIKAPWRKFFGSMLGILKTQMSLLIGQIVMEELAKQSFFSGGFGKIVALPLITGLVTGALNAMLTPIISAISSFSTGGRIDEPTLAVVGDASKSRPGSNTEWVLRDDQLAIVTENVINKYSKLQNETFYNYQNSNYNKLMLAIKEIQNSEHINNNSVEKLNLETITKTILNSNLVKYNEVVQEKEVISFASLDIDKFIKYKPELPPSVKTEKLERLIGELIDITKDKNFDLYLDSQKINIELRRAEKLRRKLKT